MEGGLTWSDDPQTEVHPMFNVDIQYIGWHLADSVFGVPGTFTNDMIFSYSGEMQMFNYHLVPLGFAYTIITGNNDSYAFMVANNAIEYKTVASTIDFGGLDDNLFPSTRKALLARILDFFGLDGVITSNNNVSSFEGVNQFYCNPNPASDKATFVFYNNKGVEASLDIFDLNGNIVKTIFTNKMLSPGKNSVTVDLTNVNGNRFSNGVYLCRLKSGQSTDLIRLVVINK